MPVGREFVRIQSRALVGDTDNQRIGRRFERRCNVLARIVGVAVQHGIDGRLSNRHRNVRNRVFVEPGPRAYSSAVCSILFTLSSDESRV